MRSVAFVVDCFRRVNYATSPLTLAAFMVEVNYAQVVVKDEVVWLETCFLEVNFN